MLYVRHNVYITEKRQIIVETLEEMIENHSKNTELDTMSFLAVAGN